MKKILSILLAAVMTVCVFAVSVVPSLAAQSPTATEAVDAKPQLQVNGKPTKTDISYNVDVHADSVTATFSYTGEGKFMRWITNLDELGFVDDEDYTLTNNTDGSISVTLYTSDAIAALENGSIIVDAIVQLDSGSTTTAGTTKKNGSSKSPGTGIAVLSATRKKDAE